MKLRKAAMTVTITSFTACGCSTNDDNLWRGHLVIAPEVETFQPCGAAEPFWLDVPLKTRDEIYAKHVSFTKEPYGRSFAIVRGDIGPKLDCGFCEEYPGSFKLVQLIEHRSASAVDCE